MTPLIMLIIGCATILTSIVLIIISAIQSRPKKKKEEPVEKPKPTQMTKPKKKKKEKGSIPRKTTNDNGNEVEETKTKSKKIKVERIIALILAIPGLTLIIMVLCLMANASKHGAFDLSYMTWPYSKVQLACDKGFIQDELPSDTEELRGSIFIFFKFGCPDCEGIYDSLVEKNIVGNIDDKIYFVSTRSTEGKALMESMRVQDQPIVIPEVPAGVYAKKNADVIPYLQYQLYVKEPVYNEKGEPTFDEDDEPIYQSVLNEDAWKRLIQYQTENR